MTRTWPVIHDAAGPARNSATPATSSGCPKRGIGQPPYSAAPWLVSPLAMSVSTTPGAMALTRTC